MVGNALKGAIIGAIQGATEFFPVSSSGHLLIAERLLGVRVPVLFDLLLHLASAAAVFLFLWGDYLRILKSPKGAVSLIIGIGVTGIVGLGLRGSLQAIREVPSLLKYFFLITSGAVFMISALPEGKLKGVGVRESAVVGLFQGLAVLPGISRSALTILGGKVAGLPFRESLRFSFLLGAPTIVAASIAEFLLEFREGSLSQMDPWAAVAGFITSFVSSLIAVGVLSSIRNRRRFAWFGIYCIGVSILLLVVGKGWGGF